MNSETLESVAGQCGIGLLYHAVFKSVPSALGNTLHNVTPEQLYEHLHTLKQHFTFLSADEFIGLTNYAGNAFVTFDDGHKTVIKNALPVLESLSIPATIYINGETFENKILWRDKIRYLIENELVDEFLAVTDGFIVDDSKPFYRYTKDPVNNSRKVDKALDEFFHQKDIDLNGLNYCFDGSSWFVPHPLLSYGNHCHSHYVMSSLPVHEQIQEIEKTRDLLAMQTKVQQSRLLSIPFGDDSDFDKDTIRAAREQDYTGVLLSRGKTNIKQLNLHGVPVAERFMPREPDIEAAVVKAFDNSL